MDPRRRLPQRRVTHEHTGRGEERDGGATWATPSGTALGMWAVLTHPPVVLGWVPNLCWGQQGWKVAEGCSGR